MKNNKRLLLAWIIALGLVGLGLLADWYLIFNCPTDLFKRILVAQPTSPGVVNPYQALYEDLLYPSVRIETENGIGSGVVISSTDKTAYIITAAHVVGDYTTVTVTFYSYHQDTKTPRESSLCLSAFVVLTDTTKDLALLRVFCVSVAKANLAPRDYVPYVFTPIWVVGCSLGYSPRPTEGCITSLCDLCVFVVNYWEMNAPIWPGNSGGGVFLKDTHELIGIAVWVKVCQGQLASTMGGIVPLQTIYQFLERLAVNGERFAVPTTEDQQPNPDNRIPQSTKEGD
jgi:S1-C subfamily serine protease